MSALSKVAGHPGWSLQECTQTGPNHVPYQSPIRPSQGHFLTFKLAVSLPWSSFSKCPEPGDYLGCLLCKETSSMLCTPSEVRAGLSLSAGDHRGGQRHRELGPSRTLWSYHKGSCGRRGGTNSVTPSAPSAIKGVVLEMQSLFLQAGLN